MKRYFFFIVLVSGLFSTQVKSQQTYQQQPLIFANNERADIGIGKDWYPNRWRISPQVANDTLKLKIYGKSESFAFRTDKDSIRFEIKPGETKSFYVKMPDAAPAFTLITAEKFAWDKIAYAKTAKKKDLNLLFEQKQAKYFDQLRKQYPTAHLLKNERSDLQKVLSILNWTHHQWKHDGGNAPKGSDGLSILNEAKAGGRFPCFAYAIVLRDQLTANGFAARVLYLKTKDAATRKGSPGHVVTEVYLKDQHKWAFIDGQFNVLPLLNGKPLNAVEFQNALSNNYEQVVLASRDQVDKRSFTEFVYDYLYYFDTAIDNCLLSDKQKVTYGGKRSIMLVPIGAENLAKIDFWKSTVDYCWYSNSINDFYPRLN